VHNTSVTDVLQWLDDARYLLDGHDFTTEVPPPYRSLSELVVILRDLDETIRGNLHTQGGWPAGDAGRALWNEAMGIAHPGHQNLSHAQFEALRNAFPRTTSGGGIVTRSFNNVYYHALGLYNRRSGNNAVTSLEVNNFITELGRVGGMHPWSGIMRTANLLISETMPAWESNIRRVPATIRTVNTYYQRMRRVLEHEHTTHQGQPVGHAVIFNAARDALAVTGRHTNVVVTPGRNTGILMYQIREAEERFTRPVAIPAQNLPVGLFNNPLHRWPDALLSGSGANRWPTSRLAIGIRYGINVNYGGGVYGGRIDKVREMAYRFNDRGTNAADTYLNMTSHMNRSIVTIDQLVGAEINITTSLTRLISTDMRTTATEAWAGVTLPADLPEHTPLDTRWVRGGSGGNRAPVLQGLYDTVRIARTYHIPNAELNTQMQSLILRGEQMLARYELPASNAQSIQNLFPAANTRNADAREVIIGIRRIAATIQRIDPATGLLIEEGINNAAINNLRLLVSRISEYQAELNNTTLGLTTLRDLHATVTVLLGLHPSPQPMLSGEALNFDEQLRALVIAASGPEPDQGIIPHDGHGLPNSRTDLSYYLAQIQDLVDAMNEILLGTDGLPETRTIVAALRNEGQGILDETVHARDILVEYIQRASSFLSNNGFGSVCPDTGEFIQTPNYEVRFAAQVHLLTVIEIMEDYLRPWSSLVTDEARVDTRAALEAQLASARIAHANAMSVPSTTTNNIVASLNSFVVFENITIIIPVTSSVLNETIMVPLPMGALHGQLNELEVLLHDITRHIPTMTDLSLVVALEAKLESTRAAEIVFAHQNLGHNNVYEVWRARRALEQFLLDYEIEIDRTPPGEDTGDQPLPDPRPDGEGLGMMLWIIIAVVLLLVLIIGFIIAKRKKKKGKSSYNY
ncbi:MAG: hypothetical protein FWC00_02245, partial [Firmicutes bacterium]|nr:hypothetical protein [Bacillota bacterium]